ncbi:MAG: SDR family oxidoreductase [Proteobacteria bacterium]|nr:SDR family oxidoreductase [Pseudomonadota bacterium]
MTNVLITGTNRGLGLEFAKQYAQAGARVFACCRTPAKADELENLARASGGKITVHALDVLKLEQIDRLATDLRGEAIDILINNAGVYGPKHQDADRMDYDGWAETFAVNTIAPLRVAQAFHPHLKKGGGKKFIAITSRMGSIERHPGDYFAYRSSKAALNSAMRGLSRAWAGDGIIVVPMHPGWVRTDMGGRGAPLEPSEAIASMRKLIGKLTPSDSGTFFDYTGVTLPW